MVCSRKSTRSLWEHHTRGSHQCVSRQPQCPSTRPTPPPTVQQLLSLPRSAALERVQQTVSRSDNRPRSVGRGETTSEPQRHLQENKGRFPVASW